MNYKVVAIQGPRESSARGTDYTKDSYLDDDALDWRGGRSKEVVVKPSRTELRRPRHSSAPSSVKDAMILEGVEVIQGWI